MPPNGHHNCTFKYEFFISYPHMGKAKQRHLIDEFAEELKVALEFLKPKCETEIAFRDKDCLEAGYNWAQKIPKALCHSRCMLLVYNDEYFSRDYCVKEFQAMRDLELKRGFSGNPDESLIIPLVVQAKSGERGRAQLPDEISELFHVDFRDILNPRQQFKNKGVREKVNRLIARLNDLQKKATSTGVDCEDFSFDQNVELKPPPESTFPGQWGSLPAK